MAGACGNGQVIFAHVIEKRIEWRDYEATVTGRKTISLRNVTNDAWEKLEFRDRIIQVSLSHGHLVVATTSQCYVYTTKNWNTPTIFDLKEGSVSLLRQTSRQFLIVESTAIYVYSYEGRMLCSPKWPGMRPDALSRQTVSISSDCVAVRDQTDEKTVHLFDSNTGKPLGDGKPFIHKQEVVEIALEQTGPPNERKLAIIDKNRDLYLVMVRKFSNNSSKGVGKLGSMVQSLRWSSDCSMLAAMQDSR